MMPEVTSDLPTHTHLYVLMKHKQNPKGPARRPLRWIHTASPITLAQNSPLGMGVGDRDRKVKSQAHCSSLAGPRQEDSYELHDGALP